MSLVWSRKPKSEGSVQWAHCSRGLDSFRYPSLTVLAPDAQRSTKQSNVGERKQLCLSLGTKSYSSSACNLSRAHVHRHLTHSQGIRSHDIGLVNESAPLSFHATRSSWRPEEMPHITQSLTCHNGEGCACVSQNHTNHASIEEIQCSGRCPDQAPKKKVRGYRFWPIERSFGKTQKKLPDTYFIFFKTSALLSRTVIFLSLEMGTCTSLKEDAPVSSNTWQSFRKRTRNLFTA